MPDRDRFVLLGYATLLMVLAAGFESARVDRARRRAIFNPDIWLWMAAVRFRTAEMMEAETSEQSGG